MKTGFNEHIASSALFAFLILLFSNGLSNPTLIALLLVFVFGSIVPDVDHPKSTPRKIFRALFVILLLSSISILLIISGGSSQDYLIPAVVALATTLLLLFLVERFIPKHRGIVHSKSAAIVFGFVCFCIILVLSFQPDLGMAFLFGASASFGYLFHLLVDYMGDRI